MTRPLAVLPTTTVTAVDDGGRGLSIRSLRPFLLLTFGLSWGAGTLFTIFADQLEPVFGAFGYTNPLFVLIVYAPAIAAIALVLRHHGVRGLASFLRRLTLWRMPIGWWVVLLLGVPAANYLGAAIAGPIADPFPFDTWYAAVPAVLLALSIGPVEELGWRGVALPLLQRRYTPLVASLILGATWGVWHLPAFFTSGTPQSSWSFAPFLLGAVAVSVLLTAMFNASGGSLLVPVLLHWQLNDPIWPDAMTWAPVVLTVAAAVAVWVDRDVMLRRGAGVADVLSADLGRAA